VIAAESLRFHHRCIAAVASAAGLRQEHVEVVVLVISSLEAIATDGHAWRCSTRTTSISDNVRYPNETAFGVIIVATNCERRGRRNVFKCRAQLKGDEIIGDYEMGWIWKFCHKFCFWEKFGILRIEVLLKMNF
jgi:hypothetical protein